MKKAILFNGPPSSGKDTVCNFLMSNFNCNHTSFKKKLIEIALCVSNLSKKEWDSIYTRDLKEIPDKRLAGMSPRQFLIDISENFIKPKFGKNYFGIMAAKNLEHGINVFSDSGFLEEIEPIIEEIGKPNILVIRIQREGFDFSGDSRSYLPNIEGIRFEDVINKNKEVFLRKCLHIVKNF